MLRSASGRVGWLGAALVAAVAASEARALTSNIAKGSLTIKLNTAATINTTTDSTPQDLTFAPGDATGRLFVATRTGNIRIVNAGSVGSTPFLSVGGAPGVSLFSSGESGLLGMAFSPAYASDGKFYTFQTENFSVGGPAADYSDLEQFPNTATNPGNQTTIREWTVNSGNANLANTTSRVLLRMNHAQTNHQGGGLRFGPDNNLYVSLGDGGGANDFSVSVSSITDGHDNTLGNGQKLTVPWGKILRINPDPTIRPNFTQSTNTQYSIPNTNPFIAGAGGALKEIYAYGLRNPFRINFDSSTGTLYAADVGQGNREEVDTIINGGNYGWPTREGTRDNQGGFGSQRSDPGSFTPTVPIAEYTHTDGEAVIGGEVYRGTAFPSMVGKYVFGDLGQQPARQIGLMLYTDAIGGTVSAFNLDSAGVQPSSNLFAVSAGPNGELYALFANGSILSINAGLFSNRWNVSTGGSWGTAANWSNGLPNLQPARANFLSAPGLTTAATINLDGNRTVGQIVFNNANAYTIASGTGGTLSIDNTGDPTSGTPSITVSGGNHIISAPISLVNGVTVNTASGAAATSLNISGNLTGSGGLSKIGIGVLTLGGASNYGNTTVSGGTLTLASTGSIASALITVASDTTFNVNGALAATATINANGFVNFAGNSGASTLNRNLAALNIGALAITKINASTFPFTPIVLHPSALSFANATSKINLTNNQLVTAATVPAIQALLNSGQIFTTSIGGVLGYADVGGGEVAVRFTLPGDTNLDGKVDVTDLGNLATNYGLTSGAVWAQGDSTGNGTVDSPDLGNMASNYGNGLAAGASFGASSVEIFAVSAATVAVPEPQVLAMLLAAPTVLLLRRRKRG